MLSLDCKTYCVAPFFLGRKGNNDLILGKKKKNIISEEFSGFFPKMGIFLKNAASFLTPDIL